MGISTSYLVYYKLNLILIQQTSTANLLCWLSAVAYIRNISNYL